MTYLKNIFICFLFALNPAQALELVNGTNQEFGMNFTPAQRAALPTVTRTIKENDSSVIGLSLAFTNIVGTNNWFRLYDNMHIYGVDVSEGRLLGNWPLIRWPYLHRPELIMYALHQVQPKISWRERIEYTPHMSFAGCLNKVPLRYGDIGNDKDNELVLFLNGELVIFSPKYQRTVFSNFYQADDWFRDQDWKKEPLVSEVDGRFYQYQSEHMIYNGISTPAYRYYSKLFTGDIDDDGNPDIVLWEKTYASNEKGGTKGFHLVSSNLKHFERDLMAQKVTEAGVTGEYLPQITTSIVLENWLTSANLTWSKGFPSVSECAGEEGKLIPEMHDPLLNDPDVLK